MQMLDKQMAAGFCIARAGIQMRQRAEIGGQRRRHDLKGLGHEH
nr:hypothetical protein [Derxia lacustris]